VIFKNVGRVNYLYSLSSLLLMEKLYFKNSKGVKLCGVLSGDSTEHVIVIAHGLGSGKDRRTAATLEKRLNPGIATFRFDFFGHGESEGQWEDITVSEAVDDILCAIEFLKKKGFTKIGLVGSSFGGIASIIAASKSDDLYVLALKCPVSDYVIKLMGYDLDKWKKQGHIVYYHGQKLKYSFAEDAMKLDAYSAAKNIKIPVLVVHGDKDVTVPVEHSHKLAEFLEKCKLEIVEGADHFFAGPFFDTMIEKIVQFIGLVD
jgi:pimeloyl-ACP methyl ester carboxylesterase